MNKQNCARDGYFASDRSDLGRIASVSTQSHNTNSKKCISCRRTLNYEFFGESRQSKDGFNSYCRECRNQKRRLNYGSTNEPYILNLSRSNEDRLNKLYVSENAELDLKALCLNQGTSHQVKIKINEISVLFHIIDSNSNTVLKFDILIQIDRYGSLQLIRKFILQELLVRSLRLFETDEEKLNLLYPDLLGNFQVNN